MLVENKNTGFDIKLPENWEKVSQASVTSFAKRGNNQDVFLDRINFVIEETNASLNEYLQGNLLYMQTSLDDFEKYKEGDITTNDGHKGKWFTYSARMGQETSKNLVYLFTHKAKGYAITCNGFDDKLFEYHQEKFNEIIKTLKL